MCGFNFQTGIGFALVMCGCWRHGSGAKEGSETLAKKFNGAPKLPGMICSQACDDDDVEWHTIPSCGRSLVWEGDRGKALAMS